MINENGQAGTEVEVTQEMVKDGMEALHREMMFKDCDVFAVPSDEGADLVRAVFRAMTLSAMTSRL